MGVAVGLGAGACAGGGLMVMQLVATKVTSRRSNTNRKQGLRIALAPATRFAVFISLPPNQSAPPTLTCKKTT